MVVVVAKLLVTWRTRLPPLDTKLVTVLAAMPMPAPTPLEVSKAGVPLIAPVPLTLIKV